MINCQKSGLIMNIMMYRRIISERYGLFWVYFEHKETIRNIYGHKGKIVNSKEVLGVLGED